MTKKMTRTEEHDFYADPENQTPQGPARRRNPKLTELVPVRFPPETLDRIRNAAGATTGRSHRGFAERSNTNSSTTPLDIGPTVPVTDRYELATRTFAPG